MRMNPSSRWLPVPVVLVLALAAPACGGSDTPTCENPIRTTTVELVDFEFDPACAATDEGATLTLRNTGQAQHNYTVEGTDTAIDLGPGTSRDLDLGGLAAGTYAVLCTYHPGMEGALRVG
jgi:plastocyanin